LETTRVDLHFALQEAARAASGGRRQRFASSGLICLEVALSLVLLIGGAMSLKSILSKRGLHPGFEIEHLAFMDLSLLGSRYETCEQRTGFIESVIARLRALPDIQSVSSVSALPMSGRWMSTRCYATDHPPANPGQIPSPIYYQAGANYFETLGLR